MMLWAAKTFSLRSAARLLRPAVVISTVAIVLGTAVVVEAPGFTRRAKAAEWTRTAADARSQASSFPTGNAGLVDTPPASVSRKPLIILPDELLHEVGATDARQTAVGLTIKPEIKPARLPNTAIRGLYVGAARTKILWMEVTAYCPCTICCGPNAHRVTASGKPVEYANGFFLAADADLFPFGTRLRVPGYHDGETVEVIDRGSAIKGHRLDVFFPTHEQAAAWGRRWLPVERK